MSTTLVESWSGAELDALGPIYPMVGTEVMLLIAGLIFWLAYHVLQYGIEKKEMEEDETAARSAERLQRVFEEEARE
ncbi:hypothetical protein [Roseovarius sp. D22-M7]|uniref:hypothetical protein n=1 Tax=Roseovarius sp. D22-M7 TaxID=3127116 RepID=UPI003010238C